MRPIGWRALALAAALSLGGCKRPPPPTPAATSASAVASASPAPSASIDTLTEASEPLPAEDAGPSVMGGEKVDGKALKSRHLARLGSDHSAVTVLRGDSALALGEAICEAVMPKRRWDTPVLLKPNLCGFDSIRDPDKTGGDDGVVGRTTNVEFTRGVVRCLKKRGYQKITIAEGCGISHAHFQRVIEITGYRAMAEEEHVPLVAMDDDGVFDVEGDRPGLPLAITGIGQSRVPNLLMPKILAEHLDHGLYVSLPKIKAHRFSVTSMAIKGMQGSVMLSDARPAYKQKYRMHRELGELLKQHKAERAEAKAADAGPLTAEQRRERRKLYVATLMAFAERMVDTLELEAPDVVLADGAPAMGGDGFQVLYPTEELVAVGGTNPVFVDRVGAELLGLWDNARLGNELLGHRTSPLIEAAAKRFGLDLGQVKIEGSGAALFGRPRPVHFRSMDGFAIHSDATPPWQPTASPVPPAPPKEGKPEATAVALGDDHVELDGKADDAVWKRATPVTWTTDWSGAKTGTTTRARFAWSSTALYALFELDNAGLFVDHGKPLGEERESLFKEDCVEIFLGHDPADPKHYLEIELGPFGHYFDLEVRLGTKHDTAWQSGARIATTQDAAGRRAVIEVALGAKEIVKLLHAGARLPLGLYRMEGRSPRQYLAWSPTRTRKPNFHVPDAFGVLRLTAAGGK
jgi:uncharacterized protein (DUF362 family)